MESKARLPGDHQPESKPHLPLTERRNLGPEAACETSKIKNECCELQSSICGGDGNYGIRWEFVPPDILSRIFGLLDSQDLFRAKAGSKLFKDHIDSDEFHESRGMVRSREFELSALHFSVGTNGRWQCGGYDLTSRVWRRFYPFSMLPPAGPSLFKDYFVHGAGGLMCVNVSAPFSMHETLIVFNPMTGRARELPPLNHPRIPVLMHLILNSDEESYKVIVAGSARAGHKDLSRKTEVFDSRTSTWTIAQDLPGPPFALNEYETGVCSNGVLYCIGALEGENFTKGILAFRVDEGIWLPHLSFPLVNSAISSIVQLVESDGEIYLFSEIKHSNDFVEHCIDRLEGVTLRTDLRSVTNPVQCTGEFRNVVSWLERPVLEVYPEYTCVPYGEGKLCIFDTILHTGTVYDVRTHGQRIETLPSPSWNGTPSSPSWERGLYSANPLTFCFEPSFKGKP